MHYASCFSIDRLAVSARIGIYDQEISTSQPITISLRLYFPVLPAATQNDHAPFIDYGALSAQLVALAQSQHFRLIEFMAQALFSMVRDYVDTQGATNVALWLKLSKCKPDVPHLHGGASFILSDLPATASTVPME